jgi:diadenosine tetraphosphate (Ap4A) HIT family hydrolase
MALINCEMCRAMIDCDAENSKPFNTALYRTHHFTVLPTIGPLVAGHAIIISRRHDFGLLSMSSDEKDDFFQVVKYSELLLGRGLLFMEHGSFIGQSGGGCIDHTHVHVLPEMADHFAILDDVLPVFDGVTTLETLINAKVDFPYIMNFNLEGGVRLYQAYNAHPQMMRKAICLKLGRLDWDWRTYENSFTIKQTIDKWQKK